MAASDSDNDDAILIQVAGDGSMDYSSWPTLVATVVARIAKTARNDFPIPILPSPQSTIPTRVASPRFLPPLPSSDASEQADNSDNSSQETNKENAIPASSMDTDATNAAPVTSTASETASSAPQPLEPGAFPPPIAKLLDDIISTLTENFQRYPPHTVQRLAELVLRPKQHYRNLPAYLHALDRVVHVTSGANMYPLPPAVPEPTAMSRLANGHGGGGTSSGLSINSNAANNIGSDEALGGALLTPIPWITRRVNGEDSSSSDLGSSSPLSSGHGATLGQTTPQGQGQLSQHRPNSSSSSSSDRQMETESTETIEGPNGMGRIETVSVSITNGIPSLTTVNRGVTQGELLRQEQRAGIIPVSQLARHGHAGGPVTAANLTAGQAAASAAATSAHTSSNASDGVVEDTPMVDHTSDEETPHVRGPGEIGAADMGPQNTTSTFQAAGMGMEMQGIDVEAAVGRRGEGQHKPPESTLSAITANSSEAPVVSSPKREAEDALHGQASKRVKETEQSEANEEQASEGDSSAVATPGEASASKSETAIAEDSKPSGIKAGDATKDPTKESTKNAKSDDKKAESASASDAVHNN